MTNELPAHLREAAPYLICDSCGRKSWAIDALGEACGMPQPNGVRCQGTFHDTQQGSDDGE